MRYLVFSLGLFMATVLSNAAEAPSQFTVGEFKFSRPTGWEWVENISSMRKAQLKVPDKDGKSSAEVVFFHFGAGGGGGTQANIDRWLGQFQEPKDKLNAKTDEVKVKGRKVTYVQAEGTYLSGMPGQQKTPQPNTTLLGAILESEEGDVFVKFTGPTTLAKSSKDTFRKMCEGAAGK